MWTERIHQEFPAPGFMGYPWGRTVLGLVMEILPRGCRRPISRKRVNPADKQAKQLTVLGNRSKAAQSLTSTHRHLDLSIEGVHWPAAQQGAVAIDDWRE